MGDIASNPGSSVLKVRKLVGILALLCLYYLPIALPRQWLLRIQTSFIEDYSCRYSSGFTPDSLASAGGYAFPIANSGGKDKDFLYIIQLFLPDYFLFSSFCLSIGSIPLLLQVFPACRCRTNGGPEADNPVCRLFRTRIDKKE